MMTVEDLLRQLDERATVGTDLYALLSREAADRIRYLLHFGARTKAAAADEDESYLPTQGVRERIVWILTKVASWTSARWDQHLRAEFGDEKTDETIAWLGANVSWSLDHGGRIRSSEQARKRDPRAVDIGVGYDAEQIARELAPWPGAVLARRSSWPWEASSGSGSSARCVLHGCPNRRDQGRFVGDLCGPCHGMITTGEVGLGETFVHRLVLDLKSEVSLLQAHVNLASASILEIMRRDAAFCDLGTGWSPEQHEVAADIKRWILAGRHSPREVREFREAEPRCTVRTTSSDGREPVRITSCGKPATYRSRDGADLDAEDPRKPRLFYCSDCAERLAAFVLDELVPLVPEVARLRIQSEARRLALALILEELEGPPARDVSHRLIEGLAVNAIKGPWPSVVSGLPVFHDLKIRGWTCRSCRGFVGEEKEVHRTCIYCEAARPLSSEEPAEGEKTDWKALAAAHRAKWEAYERDYILPSFSWAEEVGFDLPRAVREQAGHTCVELLVRHLIDTFVPKGPPLAAHGIDVIECAVSDIVRWLRRHGDESLPMSDVADQVEARAWSSPVPVPATPPAPSERTEAEVEWQRDPAASGWRSRAFFPVVLGPCWELVVYDPGDWEVRGPPHGHTLAQGMEQGLEAGKRKALEVFSAMRGKQT